MMNETEIQSSLNKLTQLALDKGIKRSSLELSFRSATSEVRLAINYYTDEHDEKPDEFRWKSFFGTVAEVCDECVTFINEFPSLEERKRASFTRTLARAIELGKVNEIDVEVLNPLVELMKRLSANALEFKQTT